MLSRELIPIYYLLIPPPPPPFDNFQNLDLDKAFQNAIYDTPSKC